MAEITCNMAVPVELQNYLVHWAAKRHRIRWSDDQTIVTGCGAQIQRETAHLARMEFDIFEDCPFCDY